MSLFYTKNIKELIKIIYLFIFSWVALQPHLPQNCTRVVPWFPTKDAAHFFSASAWAFLSAIIRCFCFIKHLRADPKPPRSSSKIKKPRLHDNLPKRLLRGNIAKQGTFLKGRILPESSWLTEIEHWFKKLLFNSQNKATWKEIQVHCWRGYLGTFLHLIEFHSKLNPSKN